jgi:hypothetical protein
MKVRNLRWLGLAVAVVAVLNQTAWAEGNRPSDNTLSAMGLGGLAVMSDDEAMNVRGLGYQGNGGSSAAVFGNSFATFTTPFGTAHSENGYAAEGKKFAKGNNFSEAGVELRVTQSKNGRKHGGMGGGKPGGGYGGGMNNGGWRGKPGGGMGGHHGGGHKPGRTTSISVRVFAGGFSSAFAH